MSWIEEKLEDGKSFLARTYEFEDFKEAWDFMNEVAELS
jgi:pterin-4a-carbinolamine dehydratase